MPSHFRNRLLYFTFVTIIISCSQTTWPDRPSQEVDGVAVNFLRFWPEPQPYTAQGDTAIVLFQGLQRGFVCAQILAADPALQTQTGGGVIQPETRIALPADGSCPVDFIGLDTAYRVQAGMAAGDRLYLKTPGGAITDSTEFVTAAVSSDSFSVVSDTTDTADTDVVIGGFAFHDSTALAPTRSLTADSLPACETFYGAVYTFSQDTVHVRFRLLRLDSSQYAGQPLCAGPHPDTVTIVPDSYDLPAW